MTADQAMSERVRLEALERHIEEALRRENLPALTAREFREHLGRVQAAREALTAVLTEPAR